MQLDQMNYEQSKAHWGGLASKFLVGKTIKLVRYMNDDELDDMGWDTANLVIFFTDGSHIFASMDDEGNDSGVLLSNTVATFKAGFEFAQRWIPVTEDIPDENYKGYVNFKIGDYVSCKKVDSQIEFLNLIDVYGFTHWRPIEYK